MGDVQVTYAEMRSSVQKLNNGKREIEDKLNQLVQMINSLTQGAFKTQSASPAFQASYEQWNKGAKSAIAGLEGMSQFLDKAIKGHEELDASLKSGLKQH